MAVGYGAGLPVAAALDKKGFGYRTVPYGAAGGDGYFAESG